MFVVGCFRLCFLLLLPSTENHTLHCSGFFRRSLTLSGRKFTTVQRQINLCLVSGRPCAATATTGRGHNMDDKKIAVYVGLIAAFQQGDRGPSTTWRKKQEQKNTEWKEFPNTRQHGTTSWKSHSVRSFKSLPLRSEIYIEFNSLNYTLTLSC